MTLFRKSYFYIVFALIMLFLLNMRVEAFNDTTLNYPIWLQHIADDFEVEVDLLVPLYSSGMDYRADQGEDVRGCKRGRCVAPDI